MKIFRQCGKLRLQFQLQLTENRNKNNSAAEGLDIGGMILQTLHIIISALVNIILMI